MFKTIGLWFLMNIAIIIVITIVWFILSNVFGISLDAYGQSYLSIWIYAAIVWFSWSFISLASSRWMAKKAYKITLITEKNEWNLDEKERIVYDTVISLARTHSIKTPEIGIYENTDPNAFATGPSKNKSLVAVSTGLLKAMDKWAIEWVVAHEMAHVLNWDMVTMTLLQWVLNTFVVFLSRIIANVIDNQTDWKFWILWYYAISIVLQIVFGILASLIAMKFSRYREFKADAWSARYVGKQKMIAWLEALKRMQHIATADNWKFASMKISWRRGWFWFKKLFSSHPDLDDRIRALENLRV